MYLKINRIISTSTAEGPGNRFVIWVQGCPIRCLECANKDTWSFQGGEKIKVSEIIHRIHETKNIDGITILGGEPFSQSKMLYHLIKKIMGNRLSVILFTGYTYGHIQKYGTYYQKKLLNSVDLLIDGHFIKEKQDFSRPLVGSLNQEFYFLTKKINQKEFFKIKNKIEIFIEKNGIIKINGMGNIDQIKEMLK